ncbi:MAG: CHAP domain-containing protein [Actinomycetaceae bacterium]|nr:CHAP domain-containing protein [Actinomycetaceae bacterium]
MAAPTPPATLSQSFREGVRSGSRFVSTQSRDTVAGSLKPTVTHFGFALASSDAFGQGMGDAQAASVGVQTAYRASGAAFTGIDMAASGIINGTTGTAQGAVTAVKNAPEIAQASMRGMQALLDSPETIKTGVKNSAVAVKDSAVATKQFVQAAPGRAAEGIKSGALTVKNNAIATKQFVQTAPGRAANVAKDGALKTSRFIREAPSKAATSVKEAGKAAAKSARHAAGAPGRAVKTVRTSAANAQKFVREGGGIMKTGMKLGKGGARAAGRGSLSFAKRSAQKITQALGRMVMKVVGAVSGVLAKFVLVPLVVILAAVLLFQSMVPSFLFAIFFEETKHQSAAIAAQDDYPWRGGLANDSGCEGGIACLNLDSSLKQLYDRAEANPVTNFYYGNCTDFVYWRVNRDKILRSGTDAQKKQVEEIRARGYVPKKSTNVNTSSWPYKYADLITIPGHGNGGQWGNDYNMPGWVKVSSARDVQPGDVLSIKGGVDGHHATAGHVAYVYAVDQDAKTVSIEQYGMALYSTQTYTFDFLNQRMAAGTYVFKHDPENTFDVGSVGGDIDADTATPEGAKKYAAARLKDYGWDTPEQYQCLVQLWQGESGWSYKALNKYSGAYGIPQSLPANKMASAGADYLTNGKTQINWGLDYIQRRPDYGSPCAAWQKWQSRSPHWY